MSTRRVPPSTKPIHHDFAVFHNLLAKSFVDIAVYMHEVFSKGYIKYPKPGKITHVARDMHENHVISNREREREREYTRDDTRQNTLAPRDGATVVIRWTIGY